MNISLVIRLIVLSLVLLNSLKSEANTNIISNKDRKIPKGYTLHQPKTKTYKLEKGEANVYSYSFRQGDACYIEIVPAEGAIFQKTYSELSYRLKGEKKLYDIKLTFKDNRFIGLFPIHPETVPGKQYLRISYKIDRKVFNKEFQFTIIDRKFETSEHELRFKNYNTGKPLSEKTRNFIEISRTKKKEAFASRNPYMLTKKLAHPRGMHYITSGFWKTRRYVRYKIENGKKIRLKDQVKIHRGLDLRGKPQTPVYAMGRGKVVLADRLYYEGNLLIIDHGNAVFTYYMHLHSILVEKGDIVNVGDKVALVGSSGMSTASHLHVSLVMRGVQVDPLTLLSLPVR
jgi:murein DD-endopeptidase MepM/ murein hydrolase activator NlpD